MATQLHVAVLPWSAFGHLIPFFQLTLGLAKAGIKVSFISTPRNIQRLPKVPSPLASLIHLVEFPLPNLDNDLLPEGAEATVDVPFEKIQHLKVAYDLLRHPFKRFILEQLPDWILIDIIPYWAAEIAAEHRIPTIHFSVYSGAAYSSIGDPQSLVGDGEKRMRPSPESLTSPPEWVDSHSLPAYRSFEATGVHEAFYGRNATGTTDAERVFKILQSSQAVAIRSCLEHEGEYLNLFEKIINRAVIPTGLLLPKKPEGRTRYTAEKPWSEIFDWLDRQKSKSVVFVGFGSECKLSKETVHEIAYGLELSGLPFLWALRKPNWAVDDVDALPLGFSDRSHGRGVVQIGWAPQMEILSHPSIGGSLFHSGWGSVIETLQFGHCLVVLPLILDQPLNARVLVEKGLAVEIERSEDGSFTREGIAKALKLAMVSEEGERLRIRAKEAAMVFGDQKLHDGYFDRFVEYLKKGARDGGE
ncbi:hypothetical protein SLA2020_511610 [Shorea laevis]